MKRTQAIVAIAFFSVLAAACGTAEKGGGAANPADAQASTAAGDVAQPVEDASAQGAVDPSISDGPCTVDADCVPATCCHPKTCVDKAHKPSCAGMMCTMDCRGGTFDCGGGKCLCRDGRCTAALSTTSLMQKLEQERAKEKPAASEGEPQ